jgi:hypothetical protein
MRNPSTTRWSGRLIGRDAGADVVGNGGGVVSGLFNEP